MPRAIEVIPAARRPADAAADALILPYERRQARKGEATGTRGTHVAFDFAETVRLRTDDVLRLDDGTLVEIVAEPEPLVEARSADLASLARLAWRLGDRHVPVQVLANRLRIRADAALEAMLEASGARLTRIDAPFEPEGGAYDSAGDRHAHAHGHHGHDRHGYHHAHDHHHHHADRHHHDHHDHASCGHDHHRTG